MAKLKNPLLALKAIGKIGSITLRRSRKQTIAEKVPVVPDAKTAAQLSWRTMYQKCVDLWHSLSSAERLTWESDARPRHMTGYAWYLSQCLRPNPGIYLPLAGGTMQGAIQMDGNQVHGLPAPVHVNDAARKAYVDAAEFFVPALALLGGGATLTATLPSGVLLWTADSYGDVVFSIPADFSSITDAVLVVIPLSTQAAADWDIRARYQSIGEARGTHDESDNASTYNVTNDILFEVDISGILTVLAAGDCVGVRLTTKNDAHDLVLLGVRFKYS